MNKPLRPPPPPPVPGNRPGTFGLGNKVATGNSGGGRKSWPDKPQTPDELLERAERYMEWCEANHITAPKVFANAKGRVMEFTDKARRTPTKARFCLHAGISRMTFHYYLNGSRGPDWQEAAQKVEDLIATTQVELGAARVIDPAVAGRLAGLTERIEQRIEAQAANENRVDPKQIANCTHPDDPDPDHPKMLFTQAQLDAGVPYPIKDVTP